MARRLRRTHLKEEEEEEEEEGDAGFGVNGKRRFTISIFSFP